MESGYPPLPGKVLQIRWSQREAGQPWPPDPIWQETKTAACAWNEFAASSVDRAATGSLVWLSHHMFHKPISCKEGKPRPQELEHRVED